MADRETPSVRPVDFAAGASGVRPRAGKLYSWRRIRRQDHLPSLTDPFSPITEQYRMLRVRLDGEGKEAAARPQVVAVTSSLPGDGKTCTALNMAIVAAQEVGRNVVLVECDLRRPRVKNLLTDRTSLGLSDVLEGRRGVTEVLRAMDRPENLSLIPAGRCPSNPVELLASDAMAALVRTLRERFDTVILDTPPALHFADASRLAPVADGYLLVVRAGKTPRDALLRTYRLLEPFNVLGVVMNGLKISSGSGYGYAYKAYSQAYRREE